MATLISPENNCTDAQPANGKDFKLTELYKFLNCKIVEVVDLRNGKLMIIDEKGKLKSDFKFNNLATFIARPVLGSGDRIAGFALIIDRGELV